jgi:hypothetical protein
MKFFDYPWLKDLKDYDFWVGSGFDLGYFLAKKYLTEIKDKPEGIEEWWDRTQKDSWEKQMNFVKYWNHHPTDNWKGMDIRNVVLYEKATWESYLKNIMLYRELKCTSIEEFVRKIEERMSEDNL